MSTIDKIPALVVEHCDENLSWVEEHLIDLSLDLHWATTGSEAVQLAQQVDFVAVLLGVDSPDDGRETVNLIRSHPKAWQLPIILMIFGSQQASLLSNWVGTDVVDCLTKPFEPVILRNKVQILRELYLQRKEIERQRLKCQEHSAKFEKVFSMVKEGEERYRRLLESVTSYVYTVTIREGEPVSTVHGTGCEAVTGFTPQEYAESPDLWYRMIHDEDRPGVLEAAQRILVESSPLTVKHRIHHKDGHIHWVRNTLVPHIDHEGNLFSYDGIIIDITERKRAERQLAKSVSQLETTLESTADGILVVDKKGVITNFNQNFLSLWRIPIPLAVKGNDEELLAFVLCQLKDPEGYIEKVHHLYAHPAEESYDVLEFTDGRVFERYSKPQQMAGEIIGRVWSFRDITERTHLEAQLRHAQKMEVVGQLAGGIAHDFNNILTVILGYGLQLQEGIDTTDTRRESIDQLLIAAERAANLTRSLLVFSRKETMTPEVVNLNDTVRNMEQFLRRIIGEDVQLCTRYTSEKAVVYADSGQLEQVVMNLATNARDAMPAGGVLAIETRLQELDDGFVQDYGYGEPGRYALVTVSDSGCGMDAEMCRKIFDPFFSTKEAGKGTGLGLSVVYGIVRQHRGYITVCSNPGVGTTFQIMIPLFAGHKQANDRPSLLVTAGGDETILVAEDDELFRKVIASSLRRFGYEVILAEDGDEAVELFKAHTKKIHLVILDMLMPAKSGWKVYEELQRVQPDVRTLFMSGYSTELLETKGVCLCDSEILMKPFRPFELGRKVREMLDA